MFRSILWVPALLLAVPAAGYGQFTHTNIPLGDALKSALQKSSLTGEGARSFHIRVVVSEPENPQSPYQGAIEEWWDSPQQWRREVTSKDGMHQTIVFAGGKKTERDEGDYFPLWLRSFVTATFDSVPDAAAWEGRGIMIDQVTLPDGRKSDACAKLKTKIGTGDSATDAFWNVCIAGDGKLSFVSSPRYAMEFHDYRGFGKKQVARRLVDDPEPGTQLVGEVTVLEDESKVKDSDRLFTPLTTDDSRFTSMSVDSAQMDRLIAGNPAVEWPTVRSGNTSGRLAMYISADANGNVREAWPLNSDNAGLEDPARDQVRKWKLRPAVDAAGNAIQVDGGLGFAFESHIDDPIPIITSADIGKVMSGCPYNPVLQKGLMPSGSSFTIRVSVNEQGKYAGVRYIGAINGSVIQQAQFFPSKCQFKPWIVNGKPTYYFIDVVFTAP